MIIIVCSVETQHTIGYGSRQTTEECPDAIIMQCIQSVVGVIIQAIIIITIIIIINITIIISNIIITTITVQACMAGIVFAKLSRPKKARNTVVFSK